MPGRLVHLAQMLRAERTDPAALRRTQDRLLRRLLQHAFDRVPAYRQLWAAAGVTPEDIAGVDDLWKLPTVDKTLIRADGPGFLDRRIRDPRSLTALRTSGSSGVTFEVLVDAAYNRWRKAQRLRPYVTNGLRPTDRVLVLSAHAGGRPTWFNRLGIFQEHRQDVSAPADVLLEAYLRIRPDVVVGYPSGLNPLADAFLAAGRPGPAPRLVFSDSELLTENVRRTVTNAFQRPIIDIFGTIEVENVAFQCHAQRGYHLAAESAVVEVVDPDGRPAAPGQPGEVVVTSLRGMAMPLIRYRLGDRAVRADDGCPCGRTLPLLRVMDGRVEDRLLLADGSTISSHTVAHAFNDLYDWVRDFRLVQRSLDRIVVYVEPAAGLTAEASRAVDALMTTKLPQLTHELVICHDGVPRLPSGKVPRVIREFDRP